MNELQQALLAAVPADGSSIGNQSLLERLKSQVPQLSEEAFWAARDGLIEQGVLQKAVVAVVRCCGRNRLPAAWLSKC